VDDTSTDDAARLFGTLVAGVVVVVLVSWLGRVVGVPVQTLWTVGVAFACLSWALLLVTVPWNLYYAARRVVQEVADSLERGIEVPAGRRVEAASIARRMLRAAVAGHLCSAAVAVAVGWVSHATLGYYVAGFFALSTLARPAVAYFAHLRLRLSAMHLETTHPRADVITLKKDAEALAITVQALQEQVAEHQQAADAALASATSGLASDLAHLRQQVSADLARWEGVQVTDRTAARTRDDELRGMIEQMVRRIDATLDGIGDSQELLTGIRALVRMIKSDLA